MTIHTEHPFAEEPDVVRRFRGRLGGAVSLWTAGEGDARAGLTVSSFLVANGTPARLIGLLDPDSDLFDALTGTGRGVVQLLKWADRGLAEACGGTAPAPGGPFRIGDWESGAYGPELRSRSRALVRVEAVEEVGWSALVRVLIDDLVVVTDEDALGHRRGRFTRIGEPEG